MFQQEKTNPNAMYSVVLQKKRRKCHFACTSTCQVVHMHVSVDRQSRKMAEKQRRGAIKAQVVQHTAEFFWLTLTYAAEVHFFQWHHVEKWSEKSIQSIPVYDVLARSFEENQWKNATMSQFKLNLNRATLATITVLSGFGDDQIPDYPTRGWLKANSRRKELRLNQFCLEAMFNIRYQSINPSITSSVFYDLFGNAQLPCVLTKK